MSKIKGQNFRAFVEGDVVTEATSCSVSVTGNTESESSKDTVGMFDEPTTLSKSWQVTVDSVDASNSTVASMVASFRDSSVVSVGWDQTSTTDNVTPSTATFSRAGSAILTDLTITFNDRQTATVSYQFTGTGDLS